MADNLLSPVPLAIAPGALVLLARYYVEQRKVRLSVVLSQGSA